MQMLLIDDLERYYQSIVTLSKFKYLVWPRLTFPMKLRNSQLKLLDLSEMA